VSRSERFTIDVGRSDEGRVLSLSVAAVDADGQFRSLRVNGSTAARVAGPVHDLLRGRGVSAKAWAGSRSIEPPSHLGAQAELLLQAVKPLRRGDRIDQVAAGVSTMSREEAAYWHAKATRPGGLRALRVLLTGGKSR
jgi:hypothetical protein